ncbi:MAG TPA: hypothetical protein VIX89_00730 [Bryobacteraceae bacterium]
MDVERTMEFILQMQAKSEARMAKVDERMAKAEERMDKADKRMDKFDKRLAATLKLVQTGMKILFKIDQKLLALTEAQRKTDRKLDRLIDSWTKRRTNGHQPKS